MGVLESPEGSYGGSGYLASPGVSSVMETMSLGSSSSSVDSQSIVFDNPSPFEEHSTYTNFNPTYRRPNPSNSSLLDPPRRSTSNISRLQTDLLPTSPTPPPCRPSPLATSPLLPVLPTRSSPPQASSSEELSPKGTTSSTRTRLHNTHPLRRTNSDHTQQGIPPALPFFDR